MSEAGDFVTLMIACKRRFESNFESLYEEDGMSVMQALVIRTIARYPGGISMIDISKEIGVSRSLITGVIRKLEETGLVLITPVDRRTTSVTLTEKGEKLLPDIERRVEESYSKVIESLTENERRILVETARGIESGEVPHNGS